MPVNYPKKILIVFLLSGLILSFSVTVSGQSLFPKKDLIFTQVIASASVSSSIAVTNRGAITYNGTLFFVKGEEGDSWNPVVNNLKVTGGQVDVLIQPGATKIFVVTDTVFSVGYAMFLSDDWSLDNHIEGNLTYFSLSGSTLLDAVGVPESLEFMVTSIPFDSFADVGISLAHPDVMQTNFTPTLKLRLFDEDGLLAAYCEIQIQPGGHFSKYLNQLPWDSAIPPGYGPIGKVEIESNVAVSGISMLVTPGSVAGAQISTLPLGGNPLHYDVDFWGGGEIPDDRYLGKMTLWIEGFFVKGYLKLTSINGTPVANPSTTMPILVNGQLINSSLDLSFYTGSSYNPADYQAWPYYMDTLDVALSINVWFFTPDLVQPMGVWSASKWLANDQNPVHTGFLMLYKTPVGD